MCRRAEWLCVIGGWIVTCCCGFNLPAGRAVLPIGRNDSLAALWQRTAAIIATTADKMQTPFRAFISRVQYLNLQIKKCWISRQGFSSQDHWNLNQMAQYILDDKVSKIVVMAGAGISTPSGIPDFRSPGTGLYDNLKQYNLPYAEAVFDINYFHKNPNSFFTLAKELYPGNYVPNYIHYFCKLLHQKGKLLRMYTQNIDGLERIAGIPKEKLVEAHGTFATATCTVCKRTYDGHQIKDDIMHGNIPLCHENLCKGVIKPDIVFFGEQLPTSFYYHLIDTSVADLLIVLGTSLEVEPFASIADAVSTETPRLLVNKQVVGSFLTEKRYKDVVLIGDIVKEVTKLVQILEWENDMAKLTT